MSVKFLSKHVIHLYRPFLTPNIHALTHASHPSPPPLFSYRPLYGGPSRVHVMAVASSETPQLGNLRASATAAGLDLHVLGLGVVYSGHEVKLSLYLDFLESQVRTP